jgi:hypothetical protein
VTSTEVTVGKPPAQRRPEIPRWDQQLRAAKNDGRKVKFQLAIETYFADEDCIVIGTVLETDKGGIKIVVEGTGKEHWIAKTAIVSTEVLDV